MDPIVDHANGSLFDDIFVVVMNDVYVSDAMMMGVELKETFMMTY